MKSMDSTSSAIDQQLSVIESVVGDGADLDGYSTLMRRGVNLTTILLADALAEGGSISDAGSASVGNIVSAVLSARGFLRGDSESAVNRITEATTLMDVLSKVLLDGAYVGQITRMSGTAGSKHLGMTSLRVSTSSAGATSFGVPTSAAAINFPANFSTDAGVKFPELKTFATKMMKDR